MASQIQTVSIELPQHLYMRLRRIATVTHRPVEKILSTTLDVALPEDANLSDELADELTAMTLYSDQALRAATESSITPAQQRRLEQLTYAGGSRSLTTAESSELTELLESYDRSVLRRAKALAVLAHRGYEVSNRSDLPVPDHAIA